MFLKKIIRKALIVILGNLIFYFRPIFLKSKGYASKLKLKKFGKYRSDIHFNGLVHITEPSKVIFGKNVHIGDGAFIRSEGGIILEDNVHISRNLTLYSVNHNYEGKRLPYDESYLAKPVKIEKNVWIGMNVCIIPGVTIGEGSIIGLGTIVTKDIEPYSIVGGHGFRKLKSRDIQHYLTLESKKEYGGIGGHPLKQSK